MSYNTESRIKNVEICAVCKVTTKKQCSACNNVYYCSREHQKSDWKVHSKNCLPMRLVVDPTIGRRYIATRRIEVDEIVLFEDKPLFFIPPTQNLMCLNCYCILTFETAKQCDNCGWHLCHDCTKHGPECELTLRYRKKKVNISEYLFVGSGYVNGIMVMRALDLREKNPDAYEKFLRLESHCAEEAKQSLGKLQMSREHHAKWIKEYMMLHNISIPEIMKIIGILQINGDTSTLPGKSYAGVYIKAAYFEHNCSPNCLKNPTIDGSIKIQAVTRIEKDEPLTISYFGGMLGSAIRQKLLKEEKYFTCTCKRCKDPTEFGTMFSAVKCINDNCTGYMLPPTFVVSREETIADFICDKCNATTPSKIVDKMIKDIHEEYKKIKYKGAIKLKKFIAKHEKIVHENHFSLTQAKLYLSFVLANVDGNTSYEMSEENITLCKKMTDLLDTLVPGSYYKRGLSLLRMYSSRYHLMHSKALSPTTRLSMMKENKETLTEACRLLRDDPVITEARIKEMLRHLEIRNFF